MSWFKDEHTIEEIVYTNEEHPIQLDFMDVQIDKENDDYIEVGLKINNETEEEIDAFLVGFQFFTVFNEYRGHMRGYSLSDIRPGKSMKMDWKFLIYEAPITGSIIAFPYKVKFKNGDIWQINLREVEKLIQEKFQLNIDILSEEEKAL